MSQITGTTQGGKRERAAASTGRLLKGQFYTPPAVCDLMLGLLPIGADTRLLDAGCGTGAFLLRAYDALRAQFPGESGVDRLQRIYGVELDRSSAETAARNLLRLHQDVLRAPPHLWVGNFIGPLPEGYGQFDLILGNPPYVRQEHVRQSEAMDKTAALDYLRARYAGYLAEHPAQKALFSQTADLYVWFFMQAQLLLKPGGHLAFITSNSWLDTAFGEAFRRFLLHHFRIELLVESACERWFEDAAINPMILILRKKGEAIDGVGPARLVRLQRPLSEWLPDPHRPDYWSLLKQRLHGLQAGEASPETAQIRKLSLTEETLPARNWGLFLRAGQPLGDVLQDPDRRWVSLESLGTVRYPLKTGINRFFYLEREEAIARGIEPEFLHPLIKSARNVQRYRITDEDCRLVLFACHLEKEKLRADGKTGALAYIAWGETQVAEPRQKRGQPVPWPEVASVRHHSPWYAVAPLPPPELLCNRFIDRRFFFARCEGRMMEDQTFYGFNRHPGSPFCPDLIAALLNSTLGCLLTELGGRRNLGEGVLQYARRDMAAFLLPDPHALAEADRLTIREAYLAMADRRILPMPEEAGMPDRQALDEAVLKALGLPPAWRDALVADLLGRIEERRALAASVRRTRR